MPTPKQLESNHTDAQLRHMASRLGVDQTNRRGDRLKKAELAVKLSRAMRAKQ